MAAVPSVCCWWLTLLRCECWLGGVVDSDVLRVEQVMCSLINLLAGCIHGMTDGVEYRGHVGRGGRCRRGVEERDRSGGGQWLRIGRQLANEQCALLWLPVLLCYCCYCG